MLIQLDVQSETPLYTQIMHHIMEGIATGQLKPGDPLPSVRSLAVDLGINFHTVNKAYQLLKEKGFVQIHRQKGVVIQPGGMPKNDDFYREKLQKEIRPLLAEALCRGMDQEQFLQVCQTVYQKIHDGEE
ncbi:GntR family transcriptional regulator [Desmospora activa]|uniref:GntR family transcriptional regulator n=1 Tax=Desmospora activa DSM 45169 TaxID=1121389 RepID=A0A2T4ZAT5_9BACL|nr:GntR family transcriptional regulator [Desmospora activa]PTM58995.1 GntR family transcriptional regulator [Desmospora activa DSM 45169]